MPKPLPHSIGSIYRSFVRWPGDVVGLVAYGVYQAEELQFIEKSGATGEGKPPFGIFKLRATAIAQVDSHYRPNARRELEAFIGQIISSGIHQQPGEGQQADRRTDGPKPAIGPLLKPVRQQVLAGELEGAIDALLVLLETQFNDPAELRHLGIISSNYRYALQNHEKGIATAEETARAHATAANSVLKLLEKIEAAHA